MHPKTFLITSILASFSLQMSMAQETFNEMSYAKDKTVFKVNASKQTILRIYDNGIDGKATKVIKMKRNGDIWQTTVKGNLKGMFYTFDTGNGECPGLFAKAVGVNGNRAAVIDMADTNPEGWADDRRPEIKSPSDLIIYELHHRDFSIDPSSGLHYKGKFLALTEPKAVSYLKNLGVNAIHILPSFDYASVDETRLDTPQYNWGYDPKNYNVPEGSYSTDPYTPSTRIREFKQMVKALHEAGIRVILDVVYNHTRWRN